MNRDSGELGAAPLDFSGMYPDADVETDLTGGITDRRPSANRSCRTVKRRQHTVSCEMTLLA